MKSVRKSFLFFIEQFIEPLDKLYRNFLVTLYLKGRAFVMNKKEVFLSVFRSVMTFLMQI